MLHLIFQSPLEIATLQRIGKDDAVLFLENSVTHLLKNATNNADLAQMLITHHLFVLLSDIETRGISVEELLTGIFVIDDVDWVKLTTEHSVIQSWF